MNELNIAEIVKSVFELNLYDCFAGKQRILMMILS